MDEERTPPRTGIDELDAALAGVAELGEVPLEEHPRLIGQAVETLGAVLGSPSPRPSGQVPIPGVDRR